jgi:toxin FitB
VKLLLDTNVISELRKGERADASVVAWAKTVRQENLYTSVLVLGEIRRGIEIKRRKDPRQGDALDRWFAGVQLRLGGRVLPVDEHVADIWGRIGSPDPLSLVDGLLSATALAHDMTLVTRNVKDVKRVGVKVVNPFA